MFTAVWTKSLRDQRRAVLGWSLGVAFMVGVAIGFWPSFAETDVLTQLMDDLPESMRAFIGTADIGTPEGYVAGRLFAFLLPAMILTFAIGLGAGVAADEERGDLELVLALPLSRARLLTERTVVVAIALGVVTVVFAGVLLVSAASVDMGLDTVRVVIAVAAVGVLGAVHAGIALAAGAVTGRRTLAIGVAAAVAFAGYLVHAFAPVSDVLDAIAFVSPWRWAYGEDVMRDALGLPGALTSILALAVLVAVALVAFTRRDIRG